MRVRNPMELAEIILEDDKGWDKAKTREVIHPPAQQRSRDRKARAVHITYFTAMVGRGRQAATFPRHLRARAAHAQALEGKWDKITKGRDHLAKPQPNFNPKAVASAPVAQAQQQKKKSAQTPGDLISDVFGGLGF